MHGKPLSSIAAELNNLLTVIAMCTDEVELVGSSREAVADLRDALQRGTALTRALVSSANDESSPRISQVTTTPSAKTVLIVEEQASVRRAVARALEERGLLAIEATSAQAALQHLESVHAIDVVVIDTSFESRRFAGRIVERYPSASVLYVGGYTDVEPLCREFPRSEVSLLCRPFTTSILVDRIDQALAKQR